MRGSRGRPRYRTREARLGVVNENPVDKILRQDLRKNSNLGQGKRASLFRLEETKS